MSLQNDLIRRARMQPAELTINANQVGALAVKCRLSTPGAPDSCDIERMILAGGMKFMDIPVRVLGRQK